MVGEQLPELGGRRGRGDAAETELGRVPGRLLRGEQRGLPALGVSPEQQVAAGVRGAQVTCRAAPRRARCCPP